MALISRRRRLLHVQKEPGSGYFEPVPVYRTIVVVDVQRTAQSLVDFDHPPSAGERLALPGREPVVIRHVITASRDGLAGIVLAWGSGEND